MEKLADVEYGDLGTPGDDVEALAVVAEPVTGRRSIASRT